MAKDLTLHTFGYCIERNTTIPSVNLSCLLQYTTLTKPITFTDTFDHDVVFV